MRFCACALLLASVTVVGGCGGGGGQVASVALGPTDVVGTYRVEGIGLPNDELAIRSNGDVVVNAESRAEREGCILKIGTCSPHGTLALNGTWRNGGVDYSITATGKLRPETRSLLLRGTVTGSNGLSRRDESFYGDWVSELEIPPPPPGDLPAGDGIELPPPPPGDPDEFFEMPPAPPGN